MTRSSSRLLIQGGASRRVSKLARGQSCFFFQAGDGIRDYKVTGVQTCALPISSLVEADAQEVLRGLQHAELGDLAAAGAPGLRRLQERLVLLERGDQFLEAFALQGAGGDEDRKSTRLNSSHLVISYAVFCLKKK